ncbi:serine-rich adhesin for platelets-like [Spea bombifrons]|uniref:serine-rich adhesin for platelets-like n=1 Tax=Spea bombifrons TaxID=233779 RepID=UPI00234BF71B|nr:serine-rich adhesin for platelets-like [Spea bombifrons]
MSYVTVFTAAVCAGLGQLENGRTFFRYGGIYASFVCNVGFNLLGHTSSTCVRGRWRRPAPVCVAPGCSLPRGIVHGSLRTSFNGAAINFMCNKGYKLRGSSLIYCDGKRWNSPIPTCRESDMMSTHLKKKSQVTGGPNVNGSLFTSPNPPSNILSGQQNNIPNNDTWQKFQTIRNDNVFISKEIIQNINKFVTTARTNIFPSFLQSTSTQPPQAIDLERSSFASGTQSLNINLSSAPERTDSHTVTSNKMNLISKNSVQISNIFTPYSKIRNSVLQATPAQPFQIKSTIQKQSPVTKIPSPKVDISINRASYKPTDDSSMFTNKMDIVFNYNVEINKFATSSPQTNIITKCKNAATEDDFITEPSNVPKATRMVPTEIRISKLNVLEDVDSQISLQHIASSKASPLSLVNEISVAAIPDVRGDSETLEKMPLLASIGNPLSKNLTNKVLMNTTGLSETLPAISAKANSSTPSSSTTESSLINHANSSVASLGNFAEDQRTRTSTVRFHGTHNSPVDNLLESNGIATTVQKQRGYSSRKHSFTNKPYALDSQTKATQYTRLAKKHYTPTYTSTVPLITTQRAALPTAKFMAIRFYDGLNKPLKRRVRCTYPPVPTHGTFRFLTIKDPLPSEYRYYIQYSCYPGYTMSQGDEYSFCLEHGLWSGVTPICEEFVPCMINNGGCSQICKVQDEGHAECSCKEGFQLLDDKRTCRDVNECGDGPQPCEQICTNTFGSYQCSCWPGLTLAEDAKSCV